ncbi:hypothetical protein C5167_020241 [Papaver somniferum]|uniref:Uncharacterized protein n=1 Tax=Papaver somniferum TaxID=3469 RepID=A0A4Y7IVP8_PAPSO|nr:hypothetical protein C5167_020241 [Papaver somniferum]
MDGNPPAQLFLEYQQNLCNAHMIFERFVYKRRVGLARFKCHCKQTFCSIYRYKDKHNYQFDYKSTTQDQITKANTVVKANKTETIWLWQCSREVVKCL